MDKFVTKTQMQTILDSRPKGVSMDEVIKGYRSNGYKVEGIDQAPTPPEPTLGTKLAATGKETMSKLGETAKRVVTGETAPTSGVLQATGNVAEGALNTVGNVITSTPVVKDVVSAVAKPISEGVKVFQDWLSNNPTFDKIVTSESAGKIADILDAHPDIARNAEAVNNIANAVLMAKGGVETAGKIATGVKTGAEATANVVKTGANAIAETPIVSGVGTVLKSTGESLKRIPSRLATNVADKQATELAIKSLPSKTAQTAVRDGVDIVDVKDISNITRTPQVNKLIKTVQDFAGGNKKVDPIEVVGQPIVERIKSLNTQAKSVGAKLGEASKTIGVLTKLELQSGVLSRLQSVNGLSGITLTPKGLLNFKGTTLESALSKADRQAIQQAYTEATKWGDGIKAHNFRQTLFENLGGKKKSLANITDTQEKAFNAIRSGLSDVIETKSPAYKTLSNEYRKIVQPLSDIRKLMKNIDPSSSEDILNMSAGLLARRITSAASSNPQIKQILNALDKAGTKATTKESVTQLQDMYNILNKYYDIAPKTGFQNLVKEGVGSSDSIIGTVKDTVKNVAGQSNAVRQKALEKLLEELGVVLK